ncbi:MAG: SDR family NAD(P)-dependent oxidoreductase [Mariprofundaceae bacterium]
MSEFKDSIHLITGASGGLGRALAVALGAEGANIVALGRDEDELAETQTRVEQAGGRCLCVPFDLGDFEHYDRLFLALKDQIPHLDGLVHCAGAIKRCAPMQHVKPQDFREAVDLNLTAPNLLTRALFPLIRRGRACSVVFVTCDMVDRDLPNWHGYGLAKRALAYAAAMWTAEHPDAPFRFNAFNPGKIRTETFRRTYGGMHPKEVPPATEVVPALMRLLAPADETRGQVIHAARSDA